MGLLNNIAFALCEIREHTWVALARPTACEGGWGDRIGMNQGSAATLDCHTDIVRGSDLPTLGYCDRLCGRSGHVQQRALGSDMHRTLVRVTISASPAILMNCIEIGDPRSEGRDDRQQSRRMGQHGHYGARRRLLQ
jgi:hypothetical protein